MASQYSLLEYDSDEEQERYPSIPLSNLSSAAFFITGLLERAGIPYGLMGGLAVRFMGGSRATRDVDIAFQAPRKMRDLWRIVEPEPRLIIPDTRLLSNIMKVFVRTDPGFDNCRTAIPVEVDLIESGFQNSPRELSINRRQITVSTSSGQRHIYAIEMFYLLRGKLTAFLARRGNQDFTDIEHLVMTYPNEIRAFANRLDPEALSFLLTYRPRWAPIFGR